MFIEQFIMISEDIMDQLETVGWQNVEKKDGKEMTELDISEIFKMIDVDKSGAVSRRVDINQKGPNLNLAPKKIYQTFFRPNLFLTKILFDHQILLPKSV